MDKASAAYKNVGFYIKVTIDATRKAIYSPESGSNWGLCVPAFTYMITL